MQYRFPVGLGPSSNTWPRWAPHFEQRASVRFMSVFIVRRRRLQLTRKNRHHKNNDVIFQFFTKSVLVYSTPTRDLQYVLAYLAHASLT